MNLQSISYHSIIKLNLLIKNKLNMTKNKLIANNNKMLNINRNTISLLNIFYFLPSFTTTKLNTNCILELSSLVWQKNKLNEMADWPKDILMVLPN